MEMSEDVIDCMMAIIQGTRSSDKLDLGQYPGSDGIFGPSRLAFLSGRTYAVPHDVGSRPTFAPTV